MGYRRRKDQLDELYNEPGPLGSVLYLPGTPKAGAYIYDRSPYRNNGTITGASWVRLNSGLWVLNFDGTDDYVDLGTPASLNTGAQSWSIALWFTSTNTAESDQLWRAGGASDALYIWLLSAAADGQIRFNVADGAQELNGGSFDSVTGSLADGKWHHVVCTWDTRDKRGRIYLDGKLDAVSDANTNIGTLENWTSNYWATDGGANDFLGQSALLAILQRALSAAAVRGFYRSQSSFFGIYS